jgi:hypothetical protein
MLGVLAFLPDEWKPDEKARPSFDVRYADTDTPPETPLISYPLLVLLSQSVISSRLPTMSRYEGNVPANVLSQMNDTVEDTIQLIPLAQREIESSIAEDTTYKQPATSPFNHPSQCLGFCRMSDVS